MADNGRTDSVVDSIIDEQKRIAARMYEQAGEVDKIHKRLDSMDETLNVIRGAIIGDYRRDGLRSMMVRTEAVATKNRETTEKIEERLNSHAIRINVLTALVVFCLIIIGVVLIVLFFGG